MTETTARIRWHEEYPGTFYGRVGTLESWGFELWQSPGDCGDYVLGDWVLTAPFIFADRRLMNGRYTLSDRDPEKLNADAERLLGEFTASLGAVFPDHLRALIENEHTHRAGAADKAGTYERMNRNWGWIDALAWVLALMPAPATSAPVAGEE